MASVKNEKKCDISETTSTILLKFVALMPNFLASTTGKTIILYNGKGRMANGHYFELEGAQRVHISAKYTIML